MTMVMGKKKEGKERKALESGESREDTALKSLNGVAFKAW